jgi:acid phosphatase (class A)
MSKRHYLSCFVVFVVLAFNAAARDAAPEPYALTNPIALARLLPPPPAPDTPAGKADLDAVLAAQRARSAADAAAAQADAEATVFRFADVLGEGFTAQKLPQTARLFARLTKTIGPTVNPAKEHWHRARPFVTSSAVEPLSRPDGDTYPSGHGALARLYAIVLADLVPGKRDAIFVRAGRFAWNRVVNGVHYPTDVESGAIAGTLIAQALQSDVAFRADFTAAQRELAAAGLH